MKSNQASPARAFGQMKRDWGLYLLLLPAVVLTLLFAYKPMYGVLIAFKDYSPAMGISDSPWAGFKYFEKFFNSYQFSSTIKNTLIISIQPAYVSDPDSAGTDGQSDAAKPV